MPIELITKNHGENILNVFSEARETIKIVSPFLGRKTCEELSKYIASNKLKGRLITRFYREDFIQNASSLDGLNLLLDAGVEIRCLIGLHSKLYLIDDTYSIITSANYALGGLFSNFELGIKIEKEYEINTACKCYFDDLWNLIDEYNLHNNNKATVTYELIENESKIVNISTSTRTKRTENSNEFKQGAILTRKSSTDLIETALQKKMKGLISKDIGGWLKFQADAQHRHDPNLSYLDSLTAFTKNKTFFPTKPVGIKPNDKLFIALVSYDKDHVATPIIIGSAYSSGFNSEFVVKGRFAGQEDWMIDYPYYVELNHVELIRGPAKNGISLLEVYRNLKGDIYPSTFGSDVQFEKIRQYHYQKDKIRITTFAENYLSEELEKKFKVFGKDGII